MWYRADVAAAWARSRDCLEKQNRWNDEEKCRVANASIWRATVTHYTVRLCVWGSTAALISQGFHPATHTTPSQLVDAVNIPLLTPQRTSTPLTLQHPNVLKNFILCSNLSVVSLPEQYLLAISAQTCLCHTETHVYFRYITCTHTHEKFRR